ncbi:alpha/beta fold hydrolase [Veronia nyctiphanis]|nr:alpha/beta fold hydrolase [Veronia nyctiphanis]
MKKYRFLVISVALLTAACSNFSTRYTPRETKEPLHLPDNLVTKSDIKQVDCSFDTKPHWPTVTCGELQVPEDYLSTSGNTVTLPFVILGEITEGGPYPLLVAGGGGPGGALGISPDDPYFITEEYWYPYYLPTLSVERPLILIDNRGVGSSQPNLNCGNFEPVLSDLIEQQPTFDESLDIYRSAVTDCRDNLLSNGVDVKQYNVINAARDINELRKLLNIEQLNLWGQSYGTRVALMYEQLFPSKTRSMVLDGVFPLTTKSYEQMPAILFETFEKVFAQCRLNDACKDRFGANLEQEFINYLSELEKEPLPITVEHPFTLKTIEIKQRQKSLSLRSSTYSTLASLSKNCHRGCMQS